MPRLRGWLADDRELLLAHRRLTEATREWEEHGRDDGYLYRGARLAAWDGRRVDRLNAAEREFLAASRWREARERRAVRRRVRLALTALATVVVVVTALAGVALVQAGRAGSERDLAVSARLTAEARNQLPLDPERALSLARQAFKTVPTAAAESVLRQAYADHRVRAAVPLDARKARVHR